MKFSRLQCVALTLGLAACASNHPDAESGGTLATRSESAPVEVVTTQVDPDNALICGNVKVTGTLVPQRVCRTRAEVEADRKTLGSGRPTYPTR
jgi:hypothetical protein